MKINAGDHACPGNVGMQRTEWDQIGISHAVKVKFTYGPTEVARKKQRTDNQDWDWNSSQTTQVLFVTDVSGLDQHERMKIQVALIA